MRGRCLRPLSSLDGTVNVHLPLVADLTWATHLVVVFEGRQFLSTVQRELCEAVPHCRRIILDTDGHGGPYVSNWLTGGVDPATVAEWAGHSLSVLMEVYAACLYGQDVVNQRRVQEALGH